jgi:hypothetical protein
MNMLMLAAWQSLLTIWEKRFNNTYFFTLALLHKEVKDGNIGD